MVNWDYFYKYLNIINKYMPAMGQGETMASQICTAVNKLIYKWYNDGDVYDNTFHLKGWLNDLSSYANWLQYYTKDAYKVLTKIQDCHEDGDYEDLLKELADLLLGDEQYLEKMNANEKIGDIYNCDGCYKYGEPEEDDDNWW